MTEINESNAPQTETFTMEDVQLAAGGPYVLIRLKPDPDPEVAYSLTLTGGGGILKVETMLAVIVDALTEATDIDGGALVEQVASRWSEQGRGDFKAAAFSEGDQR